MLQMLACILHHIKFTQRPLLQIKACHEFDKKSRFGADRCMYE